MADDRSSVAVVTMVYNELHFIPIWCRYYGGLFGNDHCYVVDHGSDDGSTQALPVNVVKIPRSPMHDAKRANFISNFVSSLLEWYDVVIYTDVDEILVADPEGWADLAEFCHQLPFPAVTAVGFNLYQLHEEAEINPNMPILGQRRWARFSPAMCKPLISTRPISWRPGFHISDQQTKFSRLFLFHLHHYDLQVALKRLDKTRAMPWGDGPPDHYQRWPEEQYRIMHVAAINLPKNVDVDFSPHDEFINSRVQWIEEFMQEFPKKRSHFYMNMGHFAESLVRIPDRFIGII